jgi:Glycosyl hydrolase family 9/Glycosyl transferase family 2
MYNNVEYVAECIESVRAQTYEHWDYVSVNNCSTDGSAEIARAGRRPDRLGGRLHSPAGSGALPLRHRRRKLQSRLRCRARRVRLGRARRAARFLLPARFHRDRSGARPRPLDHASDAALAPPGVVKGGHDAGDFSLYSASINSALFWLLSAVADFSSREDDTGIPESGNGVPDLLDEARWGLEWLLSVPEPDGGFQNTTCQERYGPYGTNRPERMSPYRAGEVGTIATGRAVGTLAFASALYRPHDAAFAELCLEAAWAGCRFLRDRPVEDSDGPTCPAVRQDGDPGVGRDVRNVRGGRPTAGHRGPPPPRELRGELSAAPERPELPAQTAHSKRRLPLSPPISFRSSTPAFLT